MEVIDSFKSLLDVVNQARKVTSLTNKPISFLMREIRVLSKKIEELDRKKTNAKRSSGSKKTETKRPGRDKDPKRVIAGLLARQTFLSNKKSNFSKKSENYNR